MTVEQLLDELVGLVAVRPEMGRWLVYDREGSVIDFAYIQADGELSLEPNPFGMGDE
jgi:hypothetical protein